MEELLDVLVLGEHDDEDVEEAVLFHILNEAEGMEGLRRNIYGNLNLDLMSPADVKSNFRFNGEDILRLRDALRLPAEIRTDTRNVVTNKEMISLLNKHRSLWEKLIELEQNAVGPDRFNNRGGKLLKEEKERNLLSKKIPKIEVQLMELANRFQARQGTPFLTFEQTVEEYINSVHDQRENTKKLKLSARKLQKESTMQTPNLPCTSVMTSKRPLAEIPVTDNKKLKATPRKVVTEPRKKRNALQIPKILVSSANRSKRLSQERQKRIEKIRRLSRQKLQRESGSYAEFQNNLTQRVDLRSTINLAASTSRDDTSELANPLTKTPDANKFKTPTRTPFRTPNNGTSSVSKLSTVKSQMKLIF